MAFDLDMTLIDSRRAILAAFQAAGRELDFIIALDAVDARMGLRLEDELLYWLPESDIEAAAACYRRHYKALAVHTELLPGADRALAYAAEIDAAVVVVTAKAQAATDVCFAAADLRPTATYCDAHGLDKAVALRSADADLYVGDTPSDMMAAVHADVPAVGVTTGSFSGQALAEAGATVVLRDLTHFPGWHRRQFPTGSS